MDETRKNFENWMTDGGAWPRAVEKNQNGEYKLMQAAYAWIVWQAAVQSKIKE